MTITPITLADLTEATLEGDGVFDTLMRANKVHLENEFNAGRIRGPEYATVYLSALDKVLSASLAFLLGYQKAEQETKLVAQQLTNAVTEETVLVASKCKLDAEYDVLILTKDKVTQEAALLAQKLLTEKAQVTAIGVDDNSVVGTQKTLYAAQSAGFLRDAEQKAAKVMVDSWNVRRTTDEGTIADGNNMLNDTAVGRAVTKLLDGVDA